MKREKRLTKKERKDSSGAGPQRAASSAAEQQHHTHIHCIACGKHLDPAVFGEPDGADFLRCDHGSDFPHCVACIDKARALVVEHDRTNQPVQKVAAWH
ncbi:MAG: hypothetical protein RL385_2162 [Pseudomonadota bacterium]|jgi:hypothetical protein